MTPDLIQSVASAWSVSLIHSTWQIALIGGLVALIRSTVSEDPRLTHRLTLAGLVAVLMTSGSTFALVLLFSGTQTWVPVPSSASPLRFILPIWTVGVVLMSVRVLVGRLQLWSLVRRSRPLNGDLSRVVREWERRLGLSARVRARMSDDAERPLLVGIVRPVILLPVAALTHLTPEQIETVIVHELIHVRRRDAWLNAGLSLVETLFFFHPVVWWMCHCVRCDRELCCDDDVIRETESPVLYARALVELETRRTPSRAAVAATGGDLMQRVRRMTRRQSAAPSTRGVGMIGLIALFFVTTGAILGALASEGIDPGKVSIAWLPDSVTQWSATIEEAAERHGVDPDLVAIVTLVESKGAADARSRIGASGLMQIMPSTAEYIARERGIEDHRADRLFDPEYNVDLGTWYLAKLSERFGKNLDPRERIWRTAVAYNGGERALHDYLSENKPLSNETRHYTDLVTRLWSERRDHQSEALAAWEGRSLTR